ncbi:unnamed protein product [Acanthoscelides obtectus]|uniref:Uncharacterized protein n=1 Tax=Acanthoscelides obtectus TaxID=200917 RepID=A0A9P0K490_ACAOB|nr:unnamed protein product [Acanthoscelides obtectus]CAK1654098.1 hypothetical protein AOBTE_LOCUS18451 [Acanthoscelides obtectus]
MTTALIMKTFPTLPTADRDASRMNLANLDQWSFSVTGDTDSTVDSTSPVMLPANGTTIPLQSVKEEQESFKMFLGIAHDKYTMCLSKNAEIRLEFNWSWRVRGMIQSS